MERVDPPEYALQASLPLLIPGSSTSERPKHLLLVGSKTKPFGQRPAKMNIIVCWTAPQKSNGVRLLLEPILVCQIE